jgi:hypothetical protein
MPNANYAVTQGVSDGLPTGTSGAQTFKVQTMATTSVRGWTGWNTVVDVSDVYVAIFSS